MLKRLCVALSLLAAVACGGSNTSPTPTAVNLTGTWKGSGTDVSEGSQFTWVLTQNGSAVTGTTSFLGERSSFNANGSATGTVSDKTLTFTFTVSFAPPFQFCTATARGSAQITNTSVAGTYTGTNSCDGGPFTSGQFTITRQSSS
jgi:hypothetical protein